MPSDNEWKYVSVRRYAVAEDADADVLQQEWSLVYEGIQRAPDETGDAFAFTFAEGSESSQASHADIAPRQELAQQKQAADPGYLDLMTATSLPDAEGDLSF